MKNTRNKRMLLAIGKTIKCRLTPESPLIGTDRIDVVINKADEAGKGDRDIIRLVRDKSMRTTSRIVTDKDGNDHLITTVPRECPTCTTYDLLLQTRHGKMVEHQNSVSIHFNFPKNEYGAVDAFDDEASEMSDFMAGKGGLK